MNNHELIRNVGVVGHIHGGKTTLMDTFIHQTHIRPWVLKKDFRYTDTRVDEQERQVSIEPQPRSRSKALR